MSKSPTGCRLNNTSRECKKNFNPTLSCRVENLLQLRVFTCRVAGNKRKEVAKFLHASFLHVWITAFTRYNLGEVDASQCSGIPIVWQWFAVTDVVDADTWCEYMQSQWAKDLGTKFPWAIVGLAVGLGVEV